MDVIVKGSPSIEIGFETKVIKVEGSGGGKITVDSSLSTTSTNPVQNKVVTEELNKKANTDGKYTDLIAGDLVGRGESVPAEFSFRASGGKSIKDGTAWIKRLKGNSVVWNQQLHNATLDEQGVWFNQRASAIYSNGEVTISATGEFSNLCQNGVFHTGHKYLVDTEIKSSNTSSVYINFAGGYDSPIASNITENYQRFTHILTLGQTQTDIFQIYAIDSAAVWSVRKCLLYDLTQMFGAGNEPTTIEEFYARKPIVEDEYGYNEGEVIHMNTESIKSVGDNAWDEQWDSGYIDPSTGKDYALAGYLRSKNLIPFVSGEYHVTKPSNASDFQILGYDHEGNIVASGLGTLVNDGNLRIEVAPNIGYIRFYCNYGSDTYKNDIMISLVHSGWKQDTDAGYQPYWQDTLSLPIIRKYFPQGMKKAGTAHDEIRYNKASGKWEAVQRIGSVDLGNAIVSIANMYGGVYACVSLNDMKLPISDKDRQNGLLCAKYTIGQAPALADLQDKSMLRLDDGIVYIKDSSYTDAASFKAAMQGVILYYELAEPIVTEITDSFRDYYKVADFGTEQMLAELPSAAFSADIIYQFNAVDMIREHEIEIAELQSIIATMQAQLASLTSNNE